MRAALLSPLLFAALAAAAAAAEGPAQEPATILIRARRVHPISGPAIADGKILIRGGKILQVGQDLVPPPGAQVVETSGEVLPGLIEGGASLGISGSPSEEFRELTPEIRAVRNVDRDSRDLCRALLSGVTAAAIAPGDRNVIGGLGAVVKTAPGRKAGDLVAADAFLQASLARETVSGNMTLRSTAPYSYYHRIPTTRMGTVFLLRRAFFEALDLSLPAGASPPEETTLARMLEPAGKSVLAETLRGRRPLRVRVREREEIDAALRIADEFQAKLVLVGFEEGMDLVPAVKDRGFRVLLPPGGDPGEELSPEAFRITLRLAALLQEAGVEFAFASGSGRAVPFLRERLVLSRRSGLEAEPLLRAATLGAARVLGLECRLGTIEPGKDADLLAVTGGGPLDATSAVEWVMVEGRIYPAGEDPRGTQGPW